MIDHTPFQRLLPVHDQILDFLSHVDPFPCLLASRYHYNRYLPQVYETFTFDDSALWGLTTEASASSTERTLQALAHVHTLRLTENPDALKRATYGVPPFKKRWKELFPNVKVIHVTIDLILYEGDARTSLGAPIVPLQNTLWFHVRRPLERVIIDMKRKAGREKWRYGGRRPQVEKTVHRLGQDLLADNGGGCDYVGGVLEELD
ncbi:hypothetical protein I317_01264 [Kwoniella heveanensis CBS 569]|nr:hypothetical protein I317_01264 [Kwoniella heveanensis CBS 569]